MATGEAGTSASTRTPSSRLNRRSFLRKSVAGLGASAFLSMPGVRAVEAATPKKVRTAYRLSSHGRRVCGACKAHDANRFYISADAANKGRAHPGCNCGIVTQNLLRGTWACYFRGGRTSVYDLRWSRPRCPPP